MEYTEQDLRNLIRNVTNSKEGLDFIYYLLDEFGTFSTSINVGLSETQNLCNLVKKEQGEFILELVREHNFEKYIELQRKRSNEKCLKTMN